MPPRPNLSHADKALAALATWAARSSKLSKEEKARLKTLGLKAARSGTQGLKHADRAEMAWLIRKAGPEKTPKWVNQLIERVRPDTDPGPQPKALLKVDPLHRLEKLGAMRDKLTTTQFEAMRSQILADPAMSRYGADDGTDPLDRLVVVGQLEADGFLTTEQVAALTTKILDVGV